MVCRNGQYRAAIKWDNVAIYGFVVEPTDYQQCLLGAMNSLPAGCRKMVILRIFEHFTPDIIAEILGMSAEEVRYFIHCSGLVIRKYLNEHGHPSIPDAKMDEIFKGWPYLEFGEISKLHRQPEFFEPRELEDEVDFIMKLENRRKGISHPDRKVYKLQTPIYR